MSAYCNVQTFAFQVIPRVVLVAYNGLVWAVLDGQRRAQRASSQQLHRWAAPSPQRDQSLGTWLERTTYVLRTSFTILDTTNPIQPLLEYRLTKRQSKNKGPLANPMSAVFRTTPSQAYTGPNHSYVQHITS